MLRMRGFEGRCAFFAGLAGIVFLLASGCGEAPPDRRGQGAPEPEVPEPEVPEPGVVRILEGPAALSKETTARFVMECSVEGCLIECRLDVADFAPCESPTALSGLGEGSHVFEARVAGASAAPAAYAWVVDTTVPTVSFLVAPPVLSNALEARFEFECDEADCEFACSFDGAAATPCVAPVELSGLSEGARSFAVEATDRAGNTGPAAVHAWTIDASSPSVSLTEAPEALSRSLIARFAFVCSHADCVFSCSLDEGTPAPCASPVVYEGLSEGAHGFEVQAVNAGVLGLASAHRWTVDSRAPQVTITAGPAAFVSETGASFEFGCDEAACVFACRLDEDAAAPCESPVSYQGLSEGARRFAVTARDPAGNEGPSATRDWVISLSPAKVTLTSAPAAISAQTSANFSFACDQGVCSFVCRLDDGVASACTSPLNYADLGDGEHSFEVIATGPNGVAGVASTHGWRIDSRAPNVSFTQSPATLTADSSASFGFACDEAICTFQCSLDGAAASVCASPASFAGLADGDHSFVVSATDAALNTSLPVTQAWTIDRSAPSTSFTNGPNNSPASSVSFAFAANEPATFRCRVDALAWASCESPLTLEGLAEGVHRFEVEATDLVGNVELAPASWRWVVGSTFINSVTPLRGAVGAPMIIDGAGFGSVQGGSRVEIGGVIATVRSWTQSSIVVIVPEELAAGPVVVAVKPVTTAFADFHVMPWISEVDVAWPAPGEAMVVFGTSFGATPGTVSVAGVAAVIEDWTDTAIALLVPMSAPPGPTDLEVQTASAQLSNRFAVTVRGADVWLNHPSPPEGRYYPSAVWTGSEAIFWGGMSDQNFGTLKNTGGRYNPHDDRWESMSAQGAPDARYGHSAVWTGHEYIVWGGWDSGGVKDSGARYDPALDRWTPISRVGAPAGRTEHSAVWTGRQMIVWSGRDGSTPYKNGFAYDPEADSWEALPSLDSPQASSKHTAVWTGSEMLVWGTGGGGRYNPRERLWTPMSTTGAPTTRSWHTAVWTGNEMIVWGGGASLNTGGRYNPFTNSWTTTNTLGAPSGRSGHSAVWTGSRMIVWGGNFGSAIQNTGSQYDPVTNSWALTPTLGASFGRAYHGAVWTGLEMIVWGGLWIQAGVRFEPTAQLWSATSAAPMNYGDGPSAWTGSELVHWNLQSRDGLRYNPQTQDLVAMSTAGSPSARTQTTSAWTGSEMIVWGGYNNPTPTNSGARYSPSEDAWTPTSTINAPSGRANACAVWTGSEMIAWGGTSYTVVAGSAVTSYLSDGGRYDPSTNTWSAMSLVGAPAGRSEASCVWTGEVLIVWGGYGEGGWLGSGARYNPSTDSWSAVSATGAPSARGQVPALWTGQLMIVWGGASSSGVVSTGARYNPATNAWSPINTAGAPEGRSHFSAVWTGTRAIIWGGRSASPDVLNSGALYDPLLNSWAATTTLGATVRSAHAAAWTGSEMLVWGGTQTTNMPAHYLP
ncbi:MAG: IPT/TIG domain-containing protein [Bradymonadaceae bacterium]|nr:IPT/TIG domain-containing protein [Lujinxingiaceae bacterium]